MTIGTLLDTFNSALRLVHPVVGRLAASLRDQYVKRRRECWSFEQIATLDDTHNTTANRIGTLRKPGGNLIERLASL